MKKIYKGLGTIIALSLLCTPATVLGAKSDKKPNPYLMPDESWISISGTAVSTGPDSFTLDYGKGSVLVEMDDWDWYAEGYKILDGDKVTVYGKIDDDLFETTSIEASSVYVENLGTYFYASAADEEYDGDYNYWITGSPIVPGQVNLKGTVTDISGREFTVNNGLQKITVDTALMPYNPLDKKGYQVIDKGDYVSVTGTIDVDFWEAPELMAATIVKIYDD